MLGCLTRKLRHTTRTTRLMPSQHSKSAPALIQRSSSIPNQNCTTRVWLKQRAMPQCWCPHIHNLCRMVRLFIIWTNRCVLGHLPVVVNGRITGFSANFNMNLLLKKLRGIGSPIDIFFWKRRSELIDFADDDPDRKQHVAQASGLYSHRDAHVDAERVARPGVLGVWPCPPQRGHSPAAETRLLVMSSHLKQSGCCTINSG